MERRRFTARNFAEQVAQEVREQGLPAHVVGSEEKGVFVHVPVDEKGSEEEIQVRLGHAVQALQTAHEIVFARHNPYIQRLPTTGKKLWIRAWVFIRLTPRTRTDFTVPPAWDTSSREKKSKTQQ